jgi:alcohol dehydrogenase, propanol-preferring
MSRQSPQALDSGAEIARLTCVAMRAARLLEYRDAGALGPGRVLAVQGIGGLGAYAVQYAKILGGGATVVAFARQPDKLAIAKAYGADHVVSTKGKSADDIRRELTTAIELLRAGDVVGRAVIKF